MKASKERIWKILGHENTLSITDINNLPILLLRRSGEAKWRPKDGPLRSTQEDLPFQYTTTSAIKQNVVHSAGSIPPRIERYGGSDRGGTSNGQNG